MHIFGGIISLHLECVVCLNCTNFTHGSFINMLVERLASQKIHRPVKMLSDSLNVSIDLTVVGILGVVSVRDLNMADNCVQYLSFSNYFCEILK